MTLNLRSNIEYNGETLPLRQLAENLGVHPTTLLNRIKLGWPENRWGVKNAHCKPINHMGVTFKSIQELHHHLGVPASTISSRKSLGWPDWRWGEPVRYMPSDVERFRALNDRRAPYLFPDLPGEVQQAALQLASSLGCSPQEAWAQIVERLV